jgi:Erv1 / Alr family
MSISLIVICHRCPGDFRQKNCAGTCVCTIDNADIRDHAEQSNCPKGYFEGFDPGKPLPPVDPALAERAKQERDEKLRGLWNLIHGRPLLYLSAPIDIPTERAFCDSIADKLKVIAGCQCGSSWKEIYAAHPPDFSSPAAYAAWSWNIHNAVTRKVRNIDRCTWPHPRLVSWMDAKKIHGWPEEWRSFAD